MKRSAYSRGQPVQRRVQNERNSAFDNTLNEFRKFTRQMNLEILMFILMTILIMIVILIEIIMMMLIIILIMAMIKKNSLMMFYSQNQKMPLQI